MVSPYILMPFSPTLASFCIVTPEMCKFGSSILLFYASIWYTTTSNIEVLLIFGLIFELGFWIGLIFRLCITHFSCKNSLKGKSGKRVGITFDKFNFKIKNILNIFLVNFFSAFAIYSQKDVKKILLKFLNAKNNSPNFIFDTRIVFLGSTPCTRMKIWLRKCCLRIPPWIPPYPIYEASISKQYFNNFQNNLF